MAGSGAAIPAPATPTLDAERLARAIARELHVDEEHGFGPNVDATYLARAIADHYDHDSDAATDEAARLAQSTEATPAPVTPTLDAVPVLRLTGEQLDAIGNEAFFVDWDEFEEFVRVEDAARFAQSTEADA